MPDVKNSNLSKIIKRLELLKSLISLEEEEEIDAHVFKLEKLGITEELENTERIKRKEHQKKKKRKKIIKIIARNLR
jgi:hypothetical protein